MYRHSFASTPLQIIIFCVFTFITLTLTVDVFADEPDGDIIYVDCVATGKGTGEDWPNAFRHLQDGLASASAGDVLFVAACTYYPDRDSLHPNGTADRSAAFHLINGVSIYGGFSPSAGADTFVERDWEKFQTVLSGNIGTANTSDNSYHVINNPKGINSTAILDGFIITGGNASGAGINAAGGGMYNETASPTVHNCSFIENAAADYGAGVYNFYSDAAFHNCSFEDNTVPSGRPGGAVYNIGSEPLFENCSFADNNAGSAGAVYNNQSSPVFTACSFAHNQAVYAGGAVYNYDSSAPEFYNCIFHHNSASYGGGIYNSQSSSCLLLNCTLQFNEAQTTGGALYNRSGCSATITNSILFYDTPQEIYPGTYTDADYSDIQGVNVFPGAGNINQGPGTDTSFHLQPGSPCIDSGDNGALPAWLDEDFEGDPRVVNGDTEDPDAVVDMGADEAPFVAVKWNLQVQSTEGGSVSLPGEGLFTFDNGEVVSLLAVPWNEYRFRSWTGDTSEIADINSPETQITMTGDASITANFELDIDPDLIVTDVWNQGDSICFQVRNIGDAPASKGHYSVLYVDNEPVFSEPVNSDLAPGERSSICFAGFQWACSGISDEVKVCADGYGHIREIDETNNCRTEQWKCDTTPPVITSPPVISSIGPTSAVINWSVDTVSEGVVLYSPKAGIYDHEVQAGQPAKSHSIELANLQPSTTYQFIVRSTDAAGNTVESGPFFFRTAPLPDADPPQIRSFNIRKGSGAVPFYIMNAEVSDNTGIEKVKFYLDDELVCIDYSPPFECQVAPSIMGMSVEEFFQEHNARMVAVDHAGMSVTQDRLFHPPYECNNVHAEITYPYPSDVYYISGTTVPAGTSIPIRVNAYHYDLDCFFTDMSGLPPGARRYFCSETHSDLYEVIFYANMNFISTSITPTGSHNYEIDWDISGLRTGTYELRVDAVDSEECIQTVTRTFRIEQGEPELNVTREVTRHGNYFQVDLIFRNLGTLDSVFDKVFDTVRGFQPIAVSTPDYDVASECSSNGEECTVLVDFDGQNIHLEPSRSVTVTYLAVPIMYPPEEAAVWQIGPVPIQVMDSQGINRQHFDRPCVLSTDGNTLETEVQMARSVSDYLVVTNPDRLFSASANAAAVDSLLSAMAELARYRKGILGYVFGDDSDDTGWIKECIATWGAGMRSTRGISDSYLSDGYLLLVGETEIIPSFTKTALHRKVHWTDMPYGDTNGHIDPELSVARIIGDDPAELILPIEASIKVIRGEPGFEYDRSHALLVSGRGDGVAKFERNVDDVSNILDDEFSVTVLKKRQVEEGGGNINTEFKLHDANMDHVFYRDHCNPKKWWGVLDTGDFNGTDPVNFEDAKPFAFACCCEAGQYEDDIPDPTADIDNIAECFLQHGTPSYIGATEISFREQNNESAKWFYNHWVNTNDSVGRTFRALKVHLGGQSGDYWSYEYNLYGDPKYGSTEPSARPAVSKGIILPPDSPYNITVPDYTVTHSDGFDHVNIPGGNMLLVEGRPAVPYYRVFLEYPPGYHVQNVTLLDRQAPAVATGLNIPLADIGVDEPEAETKGEESYTGEWWPSRDLIYEYEFNTRPDGGSVLALTLYPFYYNCLTTDVEFYKDYTFAIDAVETGMRIALFTTDRRHYTPGDPVKVQLALKGSEVPADTVVEVLVKDESSGQVVDGLLLRTLNSVSETAFFSPEWDSSGFPAGSYYLEANIRDTTGNILQSRKKSITVGGLSVDIGNFSASPGGSGVNISLSFKNTGSVETSGKAVIIVQDEHGVQVAKFSHDFSGLLPSASLNVTDAWETSGVPPGVYRLQAYIKYDSLCSEIKSLGIPVCVDTGDFARSFGGVRGDGTYSSVLDIDRDGDLDGTDLAAFLSWFQDLSCRQDD